MKTNKDFAATCKRPTRCWPSWSVPRNGASPARRGSWEGGEEERRAEARLQGLAASLTPPLAVGSEGRGRACADSKRPQGFRKRAGICDGQVRADPRGGQRRLRVSPGALGDGGSCSGEETKPPGKSNRETAARFTPLRGGSSLRLAPPRLPVPGPLWRLRPLREATPTQG